MRYPISRSRRLRQNPVLRNLVQENHLSPHDLVYPIFINTLSGTPKDIKSMPGIQQQTLSSLNKEIETICTLGIQSILLFGIPDTKDEIGSGAYSHQGIIQKAIRQIKKYFPNLFIIADTCLCEYTSHGHCGIFSHNSLDNDSSLKLLSETALSQVEAGADMIAPSAMMDGQVTAIRSALDHQGFYNIPIMSYAAKFASSYYTPFREAAEGPPQFGDRQQYQINPANNKEAIKEVLQDIEEGADIVMVKPALAYLDIIHTVKNQVQIPVAAYNVSGEYAMVKAAASQGWLDEQSIVLENMHGLKRAGADIIITYHAKDIVHWI